MGGSIHSFVFPPSLYIFPDLIISFFAYSVLNLFSILTADLHFTLTIAIFQSIFIGLFYKSQINHNNFKSKYHKKIIYDSCVLGISLLNLSLIGSDRFLDLILFTNHSGVVLLILLYLYLIQIQNPIFSIAVVFFGSISDPLFVALIILYSFLSIINKEKTLFHLTVIITALIGYGVPLLIQEFGWLEFGDEYYSQFIQAKRFNWKNIQSMFNIWIYQMRENWISSLFLIFLLFVKHPTKNRNLDKNLKIFVYANIIIAICYTSLAVYLPLRYLPLISLYFFWRIINSQLNFLNYLISVLTLMIGFFQLYQVQNLEKYELIPFLKPLEELYLSYPDSEIYLDYWYAKPVYVYSNTIPRKNIFQLDKNEEIYNWISEKKISSPNKTKIYIKLPSLNSLP
jgi:hypothetical protein